MRTEQKQNDLPSRTCTAGNGFPERRERNKDRVRERDKGEEGEAETEMK